jgi:hypothetical protein
MGDARGFGASRDDDGVPAPWASSIRRSQTKQFLADVGRDPKAYGFNDSGEVLVSLGTERDDLDPFGLIVTFVGKCIHYFGEWLTLLFLVVGAVLTVSKAIEWGQSIWTWAKNTAKTFFPALNLVLDQDPRYHDASGNDGAASGRASQALILSFLPAPIAIMAGEMAGNLSKSAPAGAPAAQVAPLTGALQGLWGLITGSNDGELSDQDVRAISEATGRSADEVRRIINDTNGSRR